MLQNFFRGGYGAAVMELCSKPANFTAHSGACSVGYTQRYGGFHLQPQSNQHGDEVVELNRNDNG